ncbi:sensor histidine kinase [Tanticharoenia sakaeratensis]|uniref:histidine kinase n=1 Tax=Tanticharoenia sakaeratensis NBRC 103193 TaxID=1231623 RepID=A0A0D6MJE9_9PROT|nr:ATP-binding protein [Tanticharoenia sakaeratensis]GAN53595.1 two component sensor histidine kinase [Tanticharoenia sakaeratensis NBRC 103193]
MWRTDLFRTATFRLTLAVVGAMVGAMVLQFGLVYVQMTHFEERRSNDLLQREAGILLRDPPARLLNAVNERTAGNLRVVINGAAVFDSGFHYIAGDLRTWPEGLVIDGEVHQLTVHPPDDDPYDMRFLAVRAPGDRILVLARSLHMLDELRYMTRRAVWISVVPIVAFSLMTGIILSHRALSRVGEMHEAIERIMGGDLHERLPAGRGRDELERLAGSVNRMLDRLEHLLDEIRDVGNDIAHDLRTPLTRARARMERALARPADSVTLGQALAQAQSDLDQCFSIITALLRIGEIENGRRRAGFGPVSLPDLVADIVDLYDPIAETEGLVLLDQVNGASLGSADRLVVYGDRDLLIEVLANLIDNAIKFTPAGGTVGIAAERRSDRVLLRVFDTGIGIAEGERGAVLGRFYRSDKSRHVPGSGLGLSLVSAILRLHDARLAIDAQSGRTENPGTVFEIAFPAVGNLQSSGEIRPENPSLPTTRTPVAS